MKSSWWPLLFLIILLGASSLASTRDDGLSGNHGSLTPTPHGPSLTPTPIPSAGYGSASLVGHLGGQPRVLAARGDHLFVGMSFELAIFDISEPLRPRRVAYQLLLPGAVQEMQIRDGFAFVAAGEMGLRVFDVREPHSSLEVGAFAPPGGVDRVWVAGQYAYVATRQRDLRVVDISNPAMPREAGIYSGSFLAEAQSLVVVGGRAFIALGEEGLLIFDVSNPAAPALVAHHPPSGDTTSDLATDGRFLYVAEGERGMRVLDTSDSRRLVEVASFPPPDPGGICEAITRVTLQGDYALLRCGSYLLVVDVSDPAMPTHLAAFPSGAEEVVLHDDLLYMSEHLMGLRMVDLSTPTAPREVGLFPTLTAGRSIVLSGKTAIVLDSPLPKLHLVDVSTPAMPAPLGMFYDSSEPVNAFAASGNRVYLIGRSFSILDVSESRSPTRLSRTAITGSDLEVVGNHVYVAAGNAGLRIIDVSDPLAPVQVGAYTGARAPWVTVAGGFAFLPGGPEGLHIVDLRDPSSPALAAIYDPGGYVTQIVVEGGHAYLVGQQDVRVLEVTNPAQPRLLGRFALPEPIQSIAVTGHRAYIASSYQSTQSRLRVLDLSDPAHPVQAGASTLTGQALDMTISDELIFLTGSTGLSILSFEEGPRQSLPVIHQARP
jgi:hypothetical protein